MPKVVDKPDTLRPYLFHGLDLMWRDGGEQATADCPFCGRSGKFSVNIQSGEWRCFVCNEGEDKGKPIRGGNAIVFLRKLQEYSANPDAPYTELASNRG